MKTLSYLSLFLLLYACQSDTSADTSLSSLPVYTPQELVRIESFDDLYFEHIGYESVVLTDGSVLLPDRTKNSVYRVSASGGLLDTVLSDGRGPAEIQDVTFMSQSVNDEVLVYDQMNRKVVVLDSLGTYTTEFIIEPWNSNNLSEIYALQDGYYLMVFPSIEFLFDQEKMPETHLVVYDSDQKTYSLSMMVPGKPYARYIVDGSVVGGKAVPFTAEHLRAYDKTTGNMFLFWSDADRIAVIDHTLDTLQVVNIESQREQLSTFEIDTLKEKTNSIQWETMRPLLPDYKAMADKMLTDQNQNIWLKLNNFSDYQQWLIVSQDGESKAVVNLPKDVMLTHVSENHLGIRLDAVTFALFKPVNL